MKQKKAESIDNLIKTFETKGAENFSADEWKNYTEKQQADILMEYRLAYCGFGEVNWCEALGTVLANDEVVNGVSERGSYPVVKKKLRQWYLRITEYADRLLEGLQTVDFSDAMKEMQTNWIGKSYGAEIDFVIKTTDDRRQTTEKLTVYTTRPDTIFGVDFMVVAPELEWINEVKSAAQSTAVDEYIGYVKSRSDRERQAEKKISGCFTGAYAINPFNGKEIPIWISEYVLAGYGTGAIMAVPCGDDRDFKFAQHFNIPITNIIGNYFNGEEANATKDAVLENSDFLNGMVMRDAIDIVLKKVEEMGIGKRKVNYRMRDAAFSRQRYWGEPFPIKWENGIAYPLAENELPLELPHVENYKPGPDGEGPLANIDSWKEAHLETNTMPGYAGSSWYFLRYMDPHNDNNFCDRKVSDYWNQVDLYIGGTEHAVGHLLYSRMWTKVLFDLGHIGFDEPFKRLVNQGMIQGSSRFVYRLVKTNQFVSKNIFIKILDIKCLEPEIINLRTKNTYTKEDKTLSELEGVVYQSFHVDVNIVDGDILNIDVYKKWRPEFKNTEFLLEDGKYICGVETEKMSKSKYNTVNPNDLVNKFGADTFRMYEMFLGPV